jgi:streptogramin lyase
VRELGAEALWNAGPAGHLFDVTEGSNGSCATEVKYLCTAQVGYDGPTGWGTPNGVITLAPPENTALPVASPATPDQAVPEATTNGTWTNNPTSYAYQWQRCNGTGGECTNISAATKSTYTPVEADVEHTLRVMVTAKNAGGEASATSEATNKVKAIGEITEFTLPKASNPWGIAQGPDGNLWYTDYGSSKIGKITTAGTITEYALPKESKPRGIAAGSDGNLWFTDWYTNQIGKITSSSAITEYPLPIGSHPAAITSGPDSSLWFTNSNAGKIGKKPTGGAITEYSGGAGDGIASGPDGNLWFTECNVIGKITTSGVVTEYSLPAESCSYGITSGPDGKMWFTEHGSSKIGKITTSGAITEYSLPKASYPTGIAQGPDGNLWFTASWKIGRITTGGTITEYSLPIGVRPEGITAGPDGNMWFTIEATSKIGKITP